MRDNKSKRRGISISNERAKSWALQQALGVLQLGEKQGGDRGLFLGGVWEGNRGLFPW